MGSTNLSYAALEALRADGPLQTYRDKLILFGQFIGSWNLDVRFFDPAGDEIFRGSGEWVFSWVLDGRAIQDVIIYSDIKDPSKNTPGERRIGSTLRYYDPSIDLWRLVFLGATSGTFITLTGSSQGTDILIEGLDMDGSHLRWSFTEITSNSFHWIGLSSKDNVTWWKEQEMFAQRRIEDLGEKYI